MELKCATYFYRVGSIILQRRLFASLESKIKNACRLGNLEEAMIGLEAMLKRDRSPPSQDILRILFLVCRGQSTQDESSLRESSRHLDVLLSHAEQVSKLKLPLVTAQISCLAAYGRAEEAWRLFKSFQELRHDLPKVPREGLLTLLELLLDGDHLDRSLKLMNMINDSGYGLTSELTQRILSKAIEGSSQDKRWSEAVWIVLKIYRNQSLPLEDGVAPLLVQWFKSNGGECIEDASIHLSGRCVSCGHQLEYGLSEIEQSTLMNYSGDVLEKEVLDFTEEESGINSFKRILKELGPFGAVVDGMNVCYVKNPGKKQEWHPKQVLHVSRDMLSITKRPVLTVMRNHMMHEAVFSQGNNHFQQDHISLLQKQYKDQGIYLFFTSNRVADDNYFIHAALSHPNTILVTDDSLGDYKALIPSDLKHLKKIFQKWQDTHQVRPKDGTISKGIYKLPPAYNRVVQWTKDNIHVPCDNGQWICIKFNNSDLHISFIEAMVNL